MTADEQRVSAKSRPGFSGAFFTCALAETLGGHGLRRFVGILASSNERHRGTRLAGWLAGGLSVGCPGLWAHSLPTGNFAGKISKFGHVGTSETQIVAYLQALSADSLSARTGNGCVDQGATCVHQGTIAFPGRSDGHPPGVTTWRGSTVESKY